MRRLRDLQLVHLHIGTRRLPARVLLVRDDTVVLTGDAHGLPGARRGPVSLAFAAGSTLVSLSGRLGPGPIPETTMFTAVDRALVPDQRAAPRLPLRLPARVEFPDDPGRPALETEVTDIAAGGVGLAGVEAERGTRVTVHVSQPDASMSLHGVVTRSTPTGCGIRFTEAPPQLAGVILKALLVRRPGPGG